jgi:hypothetical protein
MSMRALLLSTTAAPPKSPTRNKTSVTPKPAASRAHPVSPRATMLREPRKHRSRAREDSGDNDDTSGDAGGDGDPSRPDELVPDPTIAREFNITLMTLWRWSRDPDLGFPKTMKIRNRNFRSRRAIEAFKSRMLRRAIADRAHATPSSRR